MLTATLALSAACTAQDVVPGPIEDRAPQHGVLVIEPAAWDFGEIDQTEPQTATLSARNEGDDPLRLLSLDGT